MLKADISQGKVNKLCDDLISIVSTNQHNIIIKDYYEIKFPVNNYKEY